MHVTDSASLHPLPPRGRILIGGFESTYLPAYGVDAVTTTRHDVNRDADLAHLQSAGVRHVRYPLRWQRIQPSRGNFNWEETDAALEAIRERGLVPIVDLVHHTSYPDWLTDGFRAPDFGPAYVDYAEAVANRYPWLPAYTLFNEPFATLFLAGHEALWPPYDRGVDGFRRLLLSVLPAMAKAAQCWRELVPEGHHVWVDTAEHHVGTTPAGAAHAALANDRRHVVLDLFVGEHLDVDRPFLRELVRGAGERLLELTPSMVTVLGLDYYSHSEWSYDAEGSHAPSRSPVGLAELIRQYGDRYRLPLMITETNIRGLPTDRVSWLRYVMEQYEQALDAGADLHGLCWFPHVDSTDWDSLLARPAGRTDPVGVLTLDADGRRHRSVFTSVWEQAAAGRPSTDLPAYLLQEPCRSQLSTTLAGLAHWPWEAPPAHARVPAVALPDTEADDSAPDLVVLSHLRWTWVWQRPQHLVSRLAAARGASGAQTWFVEEPVPADVREPVLRQEERDGVMRVWLEIPRRSDLPATPGFDDRGAARYGELLRSHLSQLGRPEHPDVWLYTPMALDVAQRLDAGRLVYDVMDDLASFAKAPPGLQLRQRRTLSQADLVITGGRSLHAGVTAVRPTGVHLFPSGVDSAHYATSRSLRRARPDRVAGYVGVIDERIDLDLVAALAEELPDWTVRMVGPIAKIEETDLPRRRNLQYTGMAAYGELPAVMAGFDVALMPFALNDATRAISPTKTLEYLAAGLPVVSTRVPDVVADYPGVVHLADDGPAFAAACRKVVLDGCRERDLLARPIQARQEWDAIAASIVDLLADLAPGHRAAHHDGAAVPGSSDADQATA